jgi:hypothetical protein
MVMAFESSTFDIPGAVYGLPMAEIRRDEEHRKPNRESPQEFLGTGEGIKFQINLYESELIPEKKSRIDELKRDIIGIRNNPGRCTVFGTGKSPYYFGIIILFLLSVYLFIFYSSASYSAFFREFTVDDVVITKTIFDIHAIGSALNAGVTELAFILNIPLVFIVMGFLLHKFWQRKGFINYAWVAALQTGIFIFDAVLAYGITEKIYNIESGNNLSGALPGFSIGLAFTNMHFWVITLAGFLAYLVWGFVFDFVMEAHSKLDITRVNIRIKKEQIATLQQEIKQYENRVMELKMSIEGGDGELGEA